MHEVQTRIRLELLPCLTRTRWMFGNQRRLERLCEKLTCFPTHGSLPQTSHRYAMTGKPPGAAGECTSVLRRGRIRRPDSGHGETIPTRCTRTIPNADTFCCMAGRSLAYLARIPVDQVKGIGPQTMKKLNKAGIFSVTDLLLHVPRRYLDRSQIFDLSSVPLDEEVTVGGPNHQGRPALGSPRVDDDNGGDQRRDERDHMHLVPQMDAKPEREQRSCFRARRSDGGAAPDENPDFELWKGDERLVTGRSCPSTPRRAGIHRWQMRDAIANALKRSRPITEMLPM